MLREKEDVSRELNRVSLVNSRLIPLRRPFSSLSMSPFRHATFPASPRRLIKQNQNQNSDPLDTVKEGGSNRLTFVGLWLLRLNRCDLFVGRRSVLDQSSMIAVNVAEKRGEERVSAELEWSNEQRTRAGRGRLWRKGKIGSPLHLGWKEKKTRTSSR